MNPMPERTHAEQITLSPEQMRALGYAVVDHIVRHMSTLGTERVHTMTPRPEMERLLREPLPEQGNAPEEMLEFAMRTVLESVTHADHPRFFAYVPGPGNFVGAMADALVAGLNIFAGSWAMASGPAQAELVTVEWLREICGLPEGAGGLFVSGGSMANLTALALARSARLDGRRTATAPERLAIYCSDQTHSSVIRGAQVMGIAPELIRVLAADDDFRLVPAAVRAAVHADRAAGIVPLAIVANAGTTNTGAVDPLAELAALASEEGVWLHADGAYGAAAAIAERGREALRGLELVDSVSLDPHKWLFQPFECGCLLVRRGAMLRDTFRIVPEYLKDSDFSEQEVNFRDWSVQLTRSFRAFKLWMSIKTFGAAAFRSAVTWGIELAEIAERILRERECWEIVTPARLGVITFRYRGASRSDEAGNALQRELTERLTESGHAMLSTTGLRGRTVLRLCTINPRTSEEDVASTIAKLEELAASAVE